MQKGFEAKTGHKLIFVGDPQKNSSIDTLKAVMNGDVDLGASPASWDEILDIAKKAGIVNPESTLAKRTLSRDFIKI